MALAIISQNSGKMPVGLSTTTLTSLAGNHPWTPTIAIRLTSDDLSGRKKWVKPVVILNLNAYEA